MFYENAPILDNKRQSSLNFHTGDDDEHRLLPNSENTVDGNTQFLKQFKPVNINNCEIKL